MIRKDFIKKTCGLGICACIGSTFLSSNNLYADQNTETDWKDDFIKSRYAKLIEIIDLTLDEQTKNEIIENLGKDCAKDFVLKYKNDLDGFFVELRNSFGEKVTYDKAAGLIRVETPERDCPCPLVDSSKISKSICQCSVGWQTQAYNTILGKEVKAKCVETVVRGSKRCVFEIKILD